MHSDYKNIISFSLERKKKFNLNFRVNIQQKKKKC